MRICCLMHVPFEDAANIETWARSRDYSLVYTCLYEGDALPAMDSFDMLAVMGGFMNVYEHQAHPWLVPEKAFLKQAIEAGKKIVGVCLGAQLLADALGGRVTKNRHTEIGWHPVTLTDAGREHALLKDVPEEFTAFHWHGDTFSVPDGCVHLALSAGCGNQAFLYGGRVLGLQFHLEYTRQSIEKMLKFCSGDLVDGPFVQDAETLRAGFHYIDQTRAFLYSILDRLAGV